MTKAENNYDDAVSSLRIATADILEDHPEYLEIIKGSASTKRTAVAEIAQITTLAKGLGGWLSWSDAFIKWLELHTDFRIVHKDVSNNRLTPEMVDDIKFLLSLVPDWAQFVPMAQSPMGYGTLSREGDLRVKDRIDRIKSKLTEGK